MNDKNVETHGLIDSVHHIWTCSLGLMKDVISLFSLEAKLAGRSLAVILIMVVIAALLLFASWFSLLGALVAWLMTFHISLVLSLLLASGINFIFAVSLILYIVKMSDNLRFKETRKQLELMRDDNETITSKN